MFERDSMDRRRRLSCAVAWFAMAIVLLAGSTGAFAEEAVSSLAPSDSMVAGDPPAAQPSTPEEPGATSTDGNDAPSPAAPKVRPSAAANPRPVVGSRRVRFEHSAQNVVRSGPGNGFAIVGVYPRESTFPVIAKSGDWYNVRLSDTETGWVHASLCKEYDDLSDLEFRPNPKLFTRTGSFVLSGYTGAYAYDRKSNSLVLGGRLGYYVFDRVQAEAGVGWTHVKRPQEIVESLFDLSLEAEAFDMLFYHLILTYELLPGRQMVPYVSGGVGSTIMLGKSETSFNFGAGTTLFLSKRTAMRWEFRDYRFRSGADEARVVNHNVEFTIGTQWLF